jgi:integrase
MALTEMACKKAAPRDKDYKLADGNGMYLLVSTNGSKYWRWKYRYVGKEKVLALGIYPEVSLKEARDRRIDARRQLAQGIDPNAARKAAKLTLRTAQGNTFASIAWEWFAKEEGDWEPSNTKKVKSLLENHLLPHIGAYAITDITTQILLAGLRKIEAQGILETAGRTKQLAGQVFRYAIATGRADQDLAAGLKGALKSPKTINYAAIVEPKEFAALLRAIDGLNGSLIVTTAMKLAPLVFVRPGELRKMEWKELDLEKGLWDIPAEKMKMRRGHIVPLSRQAVGLLKELEPLTGRGQYVFPGERSRKVPISDNTLNAALRRLGYGKEEMTAHGFRASARTIMAEVLPVNVDLIERQLAHGVKDPHDGAYDRTKFLPQRKKMMQRWSDYLDRIKLVSDAAALQKKPV